MENYQGWTNRETWGYNLHLENDQELMDFWMEQVRNCFTEPNTSQVLNDKENALYEMEMRLQSNLKDYIDAIIQDKYEGFPIMLTDLLQFSFERINFREIAKHWIVKYAENLEYQESKGE